MRYTVDYSAGVWIIECDDGTDDEDKDRTVCHCFSQQTAEWLCCVLNNHCC